MKEKTIEVRVEGVSPLLMHKFVIKEKENTRAKKVYVPEDEAEQCTYRTEDGKLYLPNTHFKAAMVKAATDFKMSGKKSYKDYVKAGIFINEEEILLDQQEYTIHEEPVVINRCRVMSWRPKFLKWSCGFTMTITDEMLNTKTIKDILIAAGKYKGVGDHRPEYGRFSVVEFKDN